MSNLKSNWKDDKHAEEALSEFLDKYLYEKINGIGNIVGFDRIEDKEIQKLGVDVTIHTPEKDFYFDEKATLQYINRNIPTFAFELCYSGNVGWFLKDGLMTDIYCLVWPNAATTDLHNITVENFDDCEIILVNKNRLKSYIEQSISKDELLNAAFMAADGSLDWPVDDKGRWHMPGNEKLYLVATKHLAEEPVNLVIKKDILKSLCNRHIIISKENIEFKK